MLTGIMTDERGHSLRSLSPDDTGYNSLMSAVRYVHWQEDGVWLGFFEEFPDYITQGQTLAELQENLRDLYGDLTSGEIPGVRRVAELTVG
jgi:hypothetical protein